MSGQDIQKYEQMLAEDPRSRAFAPLAEAYRKAGNLDQAIRVAEDGLKIHPDYSGGLVVLGRALFEKRELEKATDILKKAVQENPESYLGQKFLGKALMDKGEIQGSLKALEAAYFLSPDDTEVEKLIEVVRRKASHAGSMDFPEKESSREEEEIPEFITYDQRKARDEGASQELQPEEVKEEEKDVSPLAEAPESEPQMNSEPLSELEEMSFEEDEEISLGPDQELFEPVTPVEEMSPGKDEELFEELGPEAAAFLEDAEDLDEEVVIIPEEEGISSFLDTAPDIPQEEIAEETAEEKPGEGKTPEPDQVPEPAEPFPVMQEKTQPIVVTPPSFSAAELAGSGPTPPESESEPPGGETVSPPVREEPGTQDAGTLSPPEQPLPEEPSPEKRVGESPGRIFPEPSAPSEESLSTETLADLYAHQGLKEKAAEIYQRILALDPENEAVRQKLEILEGDAGEGIPAQEIRPNLETPETEMVAKGADDPLRIFQGWLENVERMKKS